MSDTGASPAREPREPRDPVIVALDLPDPAQAEAAARRLRDEVHRVKVGLELFTAAGPPILERLHALGTQVFLDLKLHDIPNTVAGAARVLARWGVWMTDVHAAGGQAMMRAAAEAAREEAARLGRPAPLVVAVTVLTSLAETAWRDEVGALRSVPDQVRHWADLARRSGLDGVVASPREAALLRQDLGRDFLIVTPGIRPSWAALGDQRRVATPREALAAGADYLVVGRPVLAAADPVAAAARLRAELAAGPAAGD